MMEEIAITILFFGAIREIVGKDEQQIAVSNNSSLANLFTQLKQCYPAIGGFEGRLLFAINEEYATPQQQLRAGDRVAILPPVSGGSEGMGETTRPFDICEITREEIDARRLALRILLSCDGAIVTFEGVTRDNNRGRKVLYLEYEAYEPMAIKTMQQIAGEAHEKWPTIDRIAISHRLGRVDISNTSVAIVVASPHRKVAFEACHFLIDRLKEIVPIWKREFFEDGAVWVDPALQ